MNARRTRAVGIVVPIHNEEEHLPAALRALAASVAQLPAEVDFQTVLVLDTCSDASADIAYAWSREHAALSLSLQLGNVGAARRVGCERLLTMWPRLHRDRIWLATTDADSTVPAQWLRAQIEAHEAGAQMWIGRVDVRDWSHHSELTAQRWQDAYDQEVAPVHGASMGVDAQLYLHIGGFPPYATGEDRHLYERAVAEGVRPEHNSTERVVTSGRRLARAPLGFAHAISSFERPLAEHSKVVTKPWNGLHSPSGGLRNVS